MLVVVIILILLFGGWSGYYGHSTWGPTYPWAGPGLGIGTILLIVLLLYLLGGLRP